MRADTPAMRIRIGESLDEDFAAFCSADAAVSGITAEFQPAQKTAKGLALNVPPEVLVYLSAVATGAATAVATGAGKACGEWLWSKLRAWLEEKGGRKRPKAIVVLVGKKKLVIRPQNVSKDLAKEIGALFGEP